MRPKIRRIVEPDPPRGKHAVESLGGFGEIVLRLVVLLDRQTRSHESLNASGHLVGVDKDL